MVAQRKARRLAGVQITIYFLLPLAAFKDSLVCYTVTVTSSICTFLVTVLEPSIVGNLRLSRRFKNIMTSRLLERGFEKSIRVSAYSTSRTKTSTSARDLHFLCRHNPLQLLSSLYTTICSWCSEAIHFGEFR
jgi:hypothetical protein